MAKTPKVKKQPSTDKIPRTSGEPTNFDMAFPMWNLALLDREGPFGWRNAGLDDLCDTVIPKLQAHENCNWLEIKRNGSHHVEFSRLESEARQRLRQIGQSDIDELFSLDMGGGKRIWGILDRQVLKIIWWDPTHQVCRWDPQRIGKVRR